MTSTTQRPFQPVGSFKGKGARDRARQAAKDLNATNPDQHWEAIQVGQKKQKGNNYALRRVR